MQEERSDRRQGNLKSVFPLMDCDGNHVSTERRSGSDRRKHRRESDIARNIINIIN